MHAERFKVRTWLEEPAKWLSWAIDSGANLKDATWNLKKFWETLAPLKKSNLSTRQWGEILLLDSRSQVTYGHLLLVQAAQQAATAARFAVDTAWAKAFSLGPVLGLATALPKVQAFLAKADPGLQGYQASIRKLHDQAQAAFKTAEQMAAQSKKALQSAGADPVMASRSLDVAKQGQVIVTNDRTSVPKFIQDVATTSGPSLPGILTQSFFGVPVWIWGAAGLLLVLAVTAGPTVVSVSSARRAAS